LRLFSTLAFAIGSAFAIGAIISSAKRIISLYFMVFGFGFGFSFSSILRQSPVLGK
jgi:hypothetical protein